VYAISRVKGAIIDELRAIDRIPRSVRFKAREVEKAYVALENRLHRSPTDERHQIFNQISFVSVVALDELLSAGSERGDRLSLVDTPQDKGAEDPVAVFESQEMKGTLAEIGQVLGVTESRVCQMHTKAVLQLRAKMQDARQLRGPRAPAEAPAGDPGGCPQSRQRPPPAGAAG
jgi:RNA polymerase sigma factor FliA